MARPVTLVGAPSSIGIRPYDDGRQRRLDLAPAVLREAGLAARLGAQDAGDLIPPPYRDFTRPPGRARNEAEVVHYSRALSEPVTRTIAGGRFPLVLGGDCSIVLGCLLGARAGVAGPVGLLYLDAHADFATPAESRTGSVASMCLALAVGRGDSPLARLDHANGLVDPSAVVLAGRRDEHEAWYGHAALAASGILDLLDRAIRADGYAGAIEPTLDRVARSGLAGFWIHLDADLINPDDMPAVDSPEPGGPRLNQLAELLAPLVRHPRALGMELTIYDPELDPDRTGAQGLADLLERAWNH
jgi:arginase